jgi:hypothetical protein
MAERTPANLKPLALRVNIGACDHIEEAARLVAESDPHEAWWLLGVADGLSSDDSGSTHPAYRLGYEVAGGI